jgi:hypothetical protein
MKMTPIGSIHETDAKSGFNAIVSLSVIPCSKGERSLLSRRPIPIMPTFSPSHRPYKPEASIPIFHLKQPATIRRNPLD